MQHRSRLVSRYSFASVALVTGVLLPAKAPDPPRPHFTGPALGTVTCNSLSLHVNFSPPLNVDGGGTKASVVGTAKDCTTTVSGESISSGKVTGSFSGAPLSCTSGSLRQNGTAEVSLAVRWFGKYDAKGFAGIAHLKDSHITFTSDEFYLHGNREAGFFIPGTGGTASLAEGSSFDGYDNGTSIINTYAEAPSDTERSLSDRCRSKSGGGHGPGIGSLFLGRGSIAIRTVGLSSPSAMSSSTIFPITVWMQNPDQTTQIESGYSTLGAAAAAEGINTFLGLYDWPSAYGVDNSSGGQGAQFQAACNAGEYVISGGDPSSNTSSGSVASVQAIAAKETQAGTGTSCTKYLAGYNWDDEPPACSTNVAAQVAAIHAEDPTRATVDNMAGGWVTWDNSGCNSTANANFAAPSYPSADDYHNTDPWNADNCKAASHVSTSPWADCSWLYGYQGAIQVSLAGGKPTWEFIETGTDELGFSGQNGSSCNTTTNACSNGNEYNATAPQVNADAWAAILNGVGGIEWFCHGTAQGQNLSDSDCMGGSGSASNAIFSNLQYIDGTIQSYAPELLSTTQGSCTMQPSTYSSIDNALLTSCSGGDLSMTSSSSTEPIMGMTKTVNGTTYLFVEADRANGSTTGTYTVSGMAGKTATLAYDSAAHYDPAVSEQGHTFTLNGSGSFSDSLSGDNGAGSNHYGAGANGYQVKIYAIG